MKIRNVSNAFYEIINCNRYLWSMNTNTDFDKIDKVLSKISGKEMKGFVRQYAATHEDFATALVEKYWKSERGNYKERVEACFAHAGVSGKRFGQPQLDCGRFH